MLLLPTSDKPGWARVLKGTIRQPMSMTQAKNEQGTGNGNGSSDELTQLLVEWGDGDQTALNKLIPLVYDELRRMAHHYMAREAPEHTLQTTALVNDAYLRLTDQKRTNWQNRAQFFGIAAQLMRRILVDHARRHAYAKRGGGATQVPLDETAVVGPQRAAEILALNEALNQLAMIDARKCQIVELRYFGGFTVEETATLLEVSDVTVMRDWSLAKAWLRREIGNA
jgi:RNA polymerase sigma factor (TIGR02999 family)